MQSTGMCGTLCRVRFYFKRKSDKKEEGEILLCPPPPFGKNGGKNLAEGGG